jgi:hypothetical protein
MGTLTLGCMGGAILPLAAAFASTGMPKGLALTGVVALTNVYTTRMLLRQVCTPTQPVQHCWRTWQPAPAGPCTTGLSAAVVSAWHA